MAKSVPTSQSEIRPPEYATLELESMGALGDTIGILDKQPINVFGGIVGEKVLAQIIRYRRKRKDHVAGIVMEVLEPSPHRVAPPCPYFIPCTGCQWQHIDYNHQLEIKRSMVNREIESYESLSNVKVSKTKPSSKKFGYRNHARFNIRDSGKLGFINRITRGFIRIDRCMLMDDGINTVLQKLQGHVRETTQLSIRYGTNTSEYLVQPTLQNPNISVLSGQTHYREKLQDRIFRVASPSFFQVNTSQTEDMVMMVKDRLKLSGSEVLVDAYCGVGTFAILLARYVKNVIAIEESAAAMKDAAVNTLGISNMQYLLGKTEDILDGISQSIDALILDPPRLGCHINTLESVTRIRPKRIVYVSCNPESLARDLDILASNGFTIVSIEPVDMFPQTHHVECIATISLE